MTISRYNLTKTTLLGFATAISMLLSGCFVPLKYDIPVLQEIPSGYEGEIHKDIAELNLPELTLLTQIQAIDWSGAYTIEPLGVWMQFAPLNGSVLLDTRYVTLRSDEEELLQAVSYLGPSTAWWSPRAFAAGCGPRVYRSGISISNSGLLRQSVVNAGGLQGVRRPSAQAISIDDTSCFMFWFDTDASPDHVFVLSIRGVTRNGNSVVIPELRFEKGTVSTIRGFP